MHTQRRHAEKIDAAGAFFIFTIGDNQEKLFDAADARRRDPYRLPLQLLGLAALPPSPA